MQRRCVIISAYNDFDDPRVHCAPAERFILCAERRDIALAVREGVETRSRRSAILIPWPRLRLRTAN